MNKHRALIVYIASRLRDVLSLYTDVEGDEDSYNDLMCDIALILEIMEKHLEYVYL